MTAGPGAADRAAAEMVENITAMATGSYLRDEDRALWDPPYPPEVADEVAAVLRRMVAEVRDAAGAAGVPDAATLAVLAAHGALTTVSEAHGDAVFEEEEQADFRRVVVALAAEVGADAEEILADLDRVTEQE
ncbi:MAG: hypothetical protein L0K27_00935 [Corynebacterium nuruki]|nr:hypothetical protein [Corynebacterium nuruki]